jgi:hypothetical protein
MTAPESSEARAAAVERACEVMHDAYEAAAVGAGWETQQASRKPWSGVPEANKVTMRAAVTALLDHLAAARLLADPAPTAADGLREAVEALAATCAGVELDSGAIRDEGARYCWSLAARELRAALTATAQPAGVRSGE